MQNKRRPGFTLIELLLAMILVSLIAVACMWVFQQSLDLSNKSIGRAEVNKAFRQAQDKLRKDFVDCLPLDSRMQNFIMISRYTFDPNFALPLPRDFLSFATTTRVTDDYTLAFVSYDLVNDVLYRYVSDEYDWLNGASIPVGTQPPSFSREVVARNCVEFRVEYLWKDERPVDPDLSVDFPSILPEFKNSPDPGEFLLLHPFVNEDGQGRDLASRIKSGGLNGAALVSFLNVTGDPAELLAGVGRTEVAMEFNASPVFGTVGDKMIRVPVHKSPGWATQSQDEKTRGKPFGFNKNGDYVAMGNAPVDQTDYNRIIHIRSPNLYVNHADFDMNLSGGRVYDHQAFYPATEPFVNGTLTAPGGGVATGNDYFNRYLHFNAKPMGRGTFVPAQVRITMKIHNDQRTVLSTHSFIFHIPHAGR